MKPPGSVCLHLLNQGIKLAHQRRCVCFIGSGIGRICI